MGAAKKYGCAHNLCLTDGKVSATLYKVFKNHFGLGGPEKRLVVRKEKNMFKKFMEEFKTFALRGNVMDMAVGVIIGGAFSGIVTSLTENVLTPILKVCTGAELYSIQQIAGFGSQFVSSVVDFLINAFILFCILKAVNKMLDLGRKKEEEPAAPTTKVCPFCKSEIAIDATRCPHCTSEQPKA